MRVYVVLEEDRGCGTMVAGVFASLEAAQEFAAQSSHYWVSSEQGEEVQEGVDDVLVPNNSLTGYEWIISDIVRKCCQKLENDGMVEVAMELKQHFGVEK